MFEGQPKGLYALALANTGERFGYYTMIAVFALFLRANFGLDPGTAGLIYSSFLGLVYFLPFVGGIMADKFGFGKMVTIGIAIMFLGYLFLAIPLGSGTVAFACMLAALLFISFGTGLFKGNLQVMVGNLYDAPELAPKRDSAFSIFYMAINIGALFAPTAAVRIKEYAEVSWGLSGNDAYHFSFAVACLSLIISMIIYFVFRSTFKHVEGGERAKTQADTTEELSPADTKARIVALCLVFAVVIFFWMAFHQNGLSLTYFADEFTQRTASGVQSMAFDVVNLFMIIIIVYALFALFQGKTGKAKGIAGVVMLAAIGVLVAKYVNLDGDVTVSAPIFQQFNPFYVVALTPVSMAIFASLANKGKEPSAPRKIAYGMLVAAAGFCVMLIGSMGLLTPNEQKTAVEAGAGIFVSPNWLIGTYLILTFGELLLSPMGISFVSKVAPPKYKGMMMGGWFVATAIGNLLVMVGGYLWGPLPLWGVWLVFITLCLLSALFMFTMMKRLEKVA
ncbi:MAG: peptide MFS transporter [Prevotella sp.]|uniref:peptide MFS transporter n=1 Tax=Prevotella sp. TaxID=59823 RepID=UPI002A30F44D|nr:peptide MFS transporter [Prevotella sp.]MDD7318059.1 peptide MFS transporter [Prevotellaceae bacterium]MDY4021052.1 peptide MFS transporter [Prevotella sp.]